MEAEQIRNFCIFAHVDHGKSTLADRFLELTGTIEARKMREQFLDMHPLERERGITIKMQPVRMKYQIGPISPISPIGPIRPIGRIGPIILNLIDTPGHADFSYEVSRALAAVEGAILLVDATQGVQAQTLANLYAAQERGIVIVPVVNKIDLASARIEEAEAEIRELLGDGVRILRVSAKTGEGVEGLLAAVVERVPAPDKTDRTDRTNRTNKTNWTDWTNQSNRTTLRALVFDSKYDPYQGIIAHVRIVEGEVRRGDGLMFLATGAECDALELGYFVPERAAEERLGAGEIGYIATGIKEPERVRVGDTITNRSDRTYRTDRTNRTNRTNPTNRTDRTDRIEPLPGYREPQPVVFASVFPENQDDYPALADSLKKLRVEDASLHCEPDEAGALGRGFRIGLLGLLHMEIVAERLRREYGLSLIFSRPSVAFLVRTRDGREQSIASPSRFPEYQEAVSVHEPIARVEIVVPHRFLGAVVRLVHEMGGSAGEAALFGSDRLRMQASVPLRVVVDELYDRIKSVSEGYASFSYEVVEYRRADLARLDILVAAEPVPAFSEIVPRSDAYRIGRERIRRLKEILPRALFAVSLQASVEGRVIARETIPALKKDVTGHLYGGDRTRKMKLWKKQQKGKKRLREAGRVEIPADVFVKMVRRRV